jgi:capsular polysaccharide transport system permease protein
MNANTQRPVDVERAETVRGEVPADANDKVQRFELRQARLQIREKRLARQRQFEAGFSLPVELRRERTLPAGDPAPDAPAGIPAEPANPRTTPGRGADGAAGRRSRMQFRTWSFVRVWFVLAVVLPVIASAVYLWGFASDRYVSEFKFSVKNQELGIGTMDQSSAAAAAAGAGSGPAKYLAFFDTYVVTDYINSKQAVRDVLETIDLRQLFAANTIDRFSRLNPEASFEELYRYWASRVHADFDMLTGTGIVTVQGFTPEDAQTIAQRLLQLSEKLINNNMSRVRGDNLKFIEDQVRNAEMRLQMARKMVQDFRVSQRIVDPTIDVGQSQSLVGRLSEQLTDLTSQLAAIRPHLSRDAPTVVVLQSRIKAVEEQLVKAKADMGTVPMVGARDRNPGSGAGSNGAPEGMANRFDFYAQQLGTFETLQTDLELAKTNYHSLMQVLERTRQAAVAQHTYVLAYVRPAAAETAAYPTRFRTLFVVFVLASLFWVVTTLLGYSVRDHIA